MSPTLRCVRITEKVCEPIGTGPHPVSDSVGWERGLWTGTYDKLSGDGHAARPGTPLGVPREVQTPVSCFSAFRSDLSELYHRSTSDTRR